MDRQAGIVLALLIGVCVNTGVHAQIGDWRPDLLPVQGEFRAPSDSFHIPVPDDLPVDVLQRLSLELDGFDVTSFVERIDGVAVFQPPTPLTPGRHQLRLVYYGDDGSILELGRWQVEVRMSGAFQQASASAQADFSLQQRIADENIDTELYDSTSSQGSVSVQADGANAGWRASGRADFLYVSNELNSANGEKFDLNEYLLALDSSRWQWRVGHHNPVGSNLVTDGFYRRGLSATTGTENQRLQFTGFALRTDAITGFEHGLGATDDDNRTSGVSVSANPLKQAEKLTLSATYVDGAGDNAGVSEFGFITEAEGEALGVAADSYLFERQLRLRGEVARSQFDYDGSGGDFDKEDDQAYSMLMEISPRLDAGEQSMAVRFGLEHKEVGSYYRSLANNSLAADKRLTRLYGEWQWSTLVAQLNWARERDNVDDIDVLPTTATNQWSVNMSYTPISDRTEATWMPFARPSYTLSYLDTDQSDVTKPAGFPDWEVANETRQLQVGAYFQPGKWNWGGGVGVTLFEDDTDTSSDTRNDLIYLNAHVPVGQRLDIRPNWQLNRFTDRDFDVDYYTRVFGLGLNSIILRNRLTGSLNYALNQNNASDDSVDSEQATLQMKLVWTVLHAEGNRPGLSFDLSGTYLDVSDEVFTVSEPYNYQVFAGVQIGWAGQYPSGR